MSDGFTAFLDRSPAFYRALAANDREDRFEPRKEAWKADIEAPARLLSEIVAEELSRLMGMPHGGKALRIHRDVRYSKDKSPYRTSLALLWSNPDADPLAAASYFAVEPRDVVVACGTPGFRREALARYRAMVDAWGDRLAEIVAESGASLIEIGSPPLKRVPKPHAPDHPMGTCGRASPSPSRRAFRPVGARRATGWSRR